MFLAPLVQEEHCSNTGGWLAYLGPVGSGLLRHAAPNLADLAASAASLCAAAGAVADAVAVYLLTAVLLGELGLTPGGSLGLYRVWAPPAAWPAAWSMHGSRAGGHDEL